MSVMVHPVAVVEQNFKWVSNTSSLWHRPDVVLVLIGLIFIGVQ